MDGFCFASSAMTTSGCSNACPPAARVLSIQNGFEADLEKRDEPVEAIASFVSECLPGRAETRLTRFGSLHIGCRGRQTTEGNSQANELASALRSEGLFKVRVVEDILPYKYAKLMYNAAISPLAAAGGLDNGDLLRVPPARRLFFALLQENYRILRHAKKPLGKIGPFSPDVVQQILAWPWAARFGLGLLSDAQGPLLFDASRSARRQNRDRPL